MKMWSTINIIAAVGCVLYAIWKRIKQPKDVKDVVGDFLNYVDSQSLISINTGPVSRQRPRDRPGFSIFLATGGILAGVFLCINSGHYIWAVILQVLSVALAGYALWTRGPFSLVVLVIVLVSFGVGGGAMWLTHWLSWSPFWVINIGWVAALLFFLVLFFIFDEYRERRKKLPIAVDYERAREERMISEARSGKSLVPEFDSLVEELLRIDRYELDDNKKTSTRAFQIGVILHQMSGGSVKMMREAHLRVEMYHKSGPIAARQLSACWDDIGPPRGEYRVPGETLWSD
jgi:hypothetical protein